MHSYLANPTATREVLERYGLTLKHKLGQNFLINNHIIEAIGVAAQLNISDVVLEVGPGIGTLTCALLETGAHVVAIEADARLEEVLAKTCEAHADKLTLLKADALKVNFAKLDPRPNKLVSNLPYHVAATVVLKAFEELPHLEQAVVMVQAEVADRMAAEPGSKTYGAYSAKLRLYAEAQGHLSVSASNFMPAPHVESTVITLARVERDLSAQQRKQTVRVIDAAFAQRRKTIRNSMAAAGFDKELLDAAFVRAGIDPSCRAETRSWQDFVKLADAYGELEEQL